MISTTSNLGASTLSLEGGKSFRIRLDRTHCSMPRMALKSFRAVRVLPQGERAA